MISAEQRAAIHVIALEIAAERLVAGFLRKIRSENECPTRIAPCSDKCGCLEELKAWCRDDAEAGK